ncbi:MAG: hypothetical protein ACRESI_06480 [Gammaproteobacteria bacterium]
MAEISRRLHLVIPIQLTKSTLYAHITPIDTTTFDTFFLPIAKTFSRIYTEGLGIVAGPRVASKLLKLVAEDLGTWEQVRSGLVAEIRRLTNILCLETAGWKLYPFEDAVRNKIIDAEDASEVENAAVFFTLISHMHKRNERELIMTPVAALWGARVELLNCTEYQSSLPTSTSVESIGKKTA